MNTTAQTPSIDESFRRVVPRALPFFRRLHVYLGIALVPWFIMYAIGAFVLNHRGLVDEWFKSDRPEWTNRFDREYHRPVPADADLRAVGFQILEDFGLANRSYWAWWQNNERKQLVVTAFKFLSTTRLTYFVDQGRVLAQDSAFRLDRLFVGMHERGGYQQRPWLTKAWGLMVDIVGLAVLMWVISGLYVWWKTRRKHRTGLIVIAAGIASFAILVALL